MYTKQTLKITYQFQVITKHTLHNQQIIIFSSLKEYNTEYSNGEILIKTNSQDYLSIPSYNKTYSAQPTDNNFLSLKEYNAEYSNGENPLKIDSPLTTQNVPDICYFSYPKTKTIILPIRGKN